MIKAGLTGGYATGKSFVASEFERLGCYVIRADRLGHTVLEPGGDAYAAVIARFGPEICNPDGSINRKTLGRLVFQSPELLRELEGLIHPAVFRLEEASLSAFAVEQPAGIAVVEAAILVETGRYSVFDRLILTNCGEETQISRGMARDGLTREQVLSRIHAQMPFTQKAQHADYLIDTEGAKNQTASRVSEIYSELKKLAEHAA